MAKPCETFKLPRGLGRLVRYVPNGPWSWRRYDDRVRATIATTTDEVNRAKAIDFVYQQMALRDSKKFRLQGTKLLFSTVATEYLKVRTEGRGKQKKLQSGSIGKINTAIRAFEKFVGVGYESLQIDKIDGTLLQGFVDNEAKRITADSANLHLNCIRQILGFALSKHYILRDPSEDVEPAFDGSDDEDDDEALMGWPCPSPEEVRLILANAKPRKVDTGKVADNGSRKGRRVYKGINANDYTDLYTAICLTGMRRGEARFLTWDDVDLDHKIILIRKGWKNGTYWQPKSRSSIRRIAIVPELEVVLDRLRRTNRHNRWVFETRRGTQLSPNNPTDRLGEISRELGFENHYVLHSLRKYWASTVAQQGMPWQVMLKMFGHSDFELILKVYYAQNDDERLVAEASKIDFGLGLPKVG